MDGSDKPQSTNAQNKWASFNKAALSASTDNSAKSSPRPGPVAPAPAAAGPRPPVAVANAPAQTANAGKPPVAANPAATPASAPAAAQNKGPAPAAPAAAPATNGPKPAQPAGKLAWNAIAAGAGAAAASTPAQPQPQPSTQAPIAAPQSQPSQSQLNAATEPQFAPPIRVRSTPPTLDSTPNGPSPAQSAAAAAAAPSAAVPQDLPRAPLNTAAPAFQGAPAGGRQVPPQNPIQSGPGPNKHLNQQIAAAQMGVQPFVPRGAASPPNPALVSAGSTPSASPSMIPMVAPAVQSLSLGVNPVADAFMMGAAPEIDPSFAYAQQVPSEMYYPNQFYPRQFQQQQYYRGGQFPGYGMPAAPAIAAAVPPKAYSSFPTGNFVQAGYGAVAPQPAPTTPVPPTRVKSVLAIVDPTTGAPIEIAATPPRPAAAGAASPAPATAPAPAAAPAPASTSSLRPTSREFKPSGRSAALLIVDPNSGAPVVPLPLGAAASTTTTTPSEAPKPASAPQSRPPPTSSQPQPARETAPAPTAGAAISAPASAPKPTTPRAPATATAAPAPAAKPVTPRVPEPAKPAAEPAKPAAEPAKPAAAEPAAEPAPKKGGITSLAPTGPKRAPIASLAPVGAPSRDGAASPSSPAGKKETPRQEEKKPAAVASAPAEKTAEPKDADKIDETKFAEDMKAFEEDLKNQNYNEVKTEKIRYAKSELVALRNIFKAKPSNFPDLSDIASGRGGYDDRRGGGGYYGDRDRDRDRRGGGGDRDNRGYGRPRRGSRDDGRGGYDDRRGGGRDNRGGYDDRRGPRGDRNDRDRRGGGGRGGRGGPSAPLLDTYKPLETSNNRYVVGALQKTDIDKIKAKVFAILNKLTLDKFDTLSDQLIEHVKENVKEGPLLSEVVKIIFDKAVGEVHFSSMYAMLCEKLSKALPAVLDVIRKEDGSETRTETTFKRLLLNRCQLEFEAGANELDVSGKSDEEAADMKRRQKQRMLGNIRFIGELYKRAMLLEKIMHECVSHLLGDMLTPQEEDIELLCKLLTTIGKTLDHAKAATWMNSYFARLAKLSEHPKLPSRIRFMVLDVIDLRKRKWEQKNKQPEAKKIAEIRKDAEKEAARNRPGPQGARSQPPRNNAPPPAVIPRPGDRYAKFAGTKPGPTPVPSGPPSRNSQDVRSGSGAGYSRDPRDRDPRDRDRERDRDPRGDPRDRDRERDPRDRERDPRDRDRDPRDRDRDRDRPAREARESPRVEKEAPPAPSVSLDDFKTRARSFIKEYFSVKDFNEVLAYISDLNAPQYHAEIVNQGLAVSVDQSAANRDLFVQLLEKLVAAGKVTADNVNAGVVALLPSLPDMAMDAPVSSKNLALMTAQLVKLGLLSADVFLSAGSQSDADDEEDMFGEVYEEFIGHFLHALQAMHEGNAAATKAALKGAQLSSLVKTRSPSDLAGAFKFDASLL